MEWACTMDYYSSNYLYFSSPDETETDSSYVVVDLASSSSHFNAWHQWFRTIWLSFFCRSSATFYHAHVYQFEKKSVDAVALDTSDYRHTGKFLGSTMD